MMKLTLYTCVNDAEHVRKECAIREKGMGNRWGRNGEQVRKECWNRWETIRKQVKRWCSAAETDALW